jgi:hypothetical protein
MLKKLFFSLTALIVLSLVAMADDKSVMLTGNIVDKACANNKVAKKENPQTAAADEPKACVLRCAKSGLGIYADGKYVEFDEKGAAMAQAALEKSSKDKGAKFKVKGKVAEGKMTVESVSEVE